MPDEYDQIIHTIVHKDRRYAKGAYYFMQEAVNYSAQQLEKPAVGEERHLSIDELLEGIRQYALDEFGPMAFWVLDLWNVKSCRDFGCIVFNMIEFELLSSSPRDRQEDFDLGYDFDTAFRQPFMREPGPVPPLPKIDRMIV